MKPVLSCFLILTMAVSGQAAPRHVLVRDFRTVKDGQVVSFNIGTAAHGPATVKKNGKRRFRTNRTALGKSQKRFWDWPKIFFVQCFQGSREKPG